MERSKAFPLAILFLVSQISHGFSGPVTVPAFLWSSYGLGSSQNTMKEVVNYRTMSPVELANSVLLEGGWSNLLCPERSLQQNVDVALVFVGRKLKSCDISKQSNGNLLVDFLKLSFTSSNFSMAFPYVAKADEEVALEDSLISEFIKNCGDNLGVNSIASSVACSVASEGLTKLSDLHSVQEYLSSKVQNKMEGQTDLVVFCDEDSQESGHANSDGKTFSELMLLLEKLGATYTVLYTSDPFKSLQHPSSMPLERFLVEGSLGNSTRCDGVCQIKSSLLEGVFVGIVLLIILLSGLCCMMGIDTPTRFETPQES